MFFKKREVLNLGFVIVLVGCRLELMPIVEESEGLVKTGSMVLPLNDAVEYFSSEGIRYLLFNVTVPLFAELEKLNSIRESEVLRGMFEQVEPKRFMDYLPMVILGLVSLVTLLVHK